MATQQMWAAIGNINWMAKNTDGSLKKLSKQVDYTHDLAAAASKQADATKLLGDATKSQNDVLEKQIDAMKNGQLMQDRPWIEPVNIDMEGPLTFNVNGMNFTFVFKLKNTGHAPALNVNIDPVMYNSGVRRTNNGAEEIQKSACASGRRITLFLCLGYLVPRSASYSGHQSDGQRGRNQKVRRKEFCIPAAHGLHYISLSIGQIGSSNRIQL